MSILVVGDLHLTGRKQDGYRWTILKFVEKFVQRKPQDAVVFLGDLTELKDFHPSALVNRLVAQLERIAKHVPEIHIVKGNHDYLDPMNPFFAFLGRIDKVFFHTVPTDKKIGGMSVRFIPHTDRWKSVAFQGNKYWDYVFLHQTVTGAISESGKKLEGVDLQSLMKRFRKSTFIAGDVHVPQKLHRRFIYCGAPHPIRFGDEYTPRILVLESPKKIRSIEPLSIRKLTRTIRTTDEINGLALQPGDQVQLVLEITRKEFAKWEKYAKTARAKVTGSGASLCGLEMREISPNAARDVVKRAYKPQASPLLTLKKYCVLHSLDKPLRRAGKRYLRSVCQK